MKVHVKGNLRDLLAFRGLGRRRQKQIARAPAQGTGQNPVNQLVGQLHPGRQHLTIADRRAILEILRNTKPSLPESWRQADLAAEFAQ